MIVKYKQVGRDQLQNCPAEVDMATGVISINMDVWDDYDDFEKSFVIAHEVGHYVLDTDDEKEADLYALKAVYKTAPKSLRRSIQTLYRIGIVDTERMMSLYKHALSIDAQEGNQAAAIELQSIDNDFNQQFYTNQKTEKEMKKPMYIYRRADGAEVIETVTETKKKGHGLNGVNLGGYYFSFTNIMLIVIAVMLFVIYKK